jgi:cytochrome c556
MRRYAVWLMVALSVGSIGAGAAQDARREVRMPTMMRDHMLANMRDHLKALHEIQAALAEGKLDLAADVAETRIGMSSLEAHGAAHMAPYMPQPMQDIGTEMHHAASRFARSAHEGDLQKALTDLGSITQQCVACHAGYRVH